MISAYFLSVTEKRKFSKIVELVIQVSVFQVIFYIISCSLGNIFSIKNLCITLIPINYFVTLYSALYIISPYINILISKLNKENFKKLIIISILVFSVWTFAIDIFGLFVKNSILLLSGLYFVLYILSIIEHRFSSKTTVIWNYNNPLLICIPALIMICFVQINFKSKIINELAKASFTCYLLHSTLLKYFGIEKAVNSKIFY